MYLVQKPWNALNLVHHHLGARKECAQFCRERLRIDQVGLVQTLIEQVNPASFRECPLCPGALSDSSGPEEEKALACRLVDARINRMFQSCVNHAVILRRIMTIW
jgi:hypothetical protein